MSVSPVRLAVIGANEIVTKGVAALVAEFPDRVHLVPYPCAPAGDEPDVVLYDAISLHTGDGHDLDLVVKEASAAVVVLAREARPDLTSRALNRGADWSVSLESDAGQLLQVIEAAAAGDLDDEAAPAPLAPASLRALNGAGLSPREAEMLDYIAQGIPNVEIAERCFLSVNSVKTYIRSAYRKIGVNNRSQAVLWFVQHGLPEQQED